MTFWPKMGVLCGKIGEGLVRYWPLTNSFFLLGFFTSVPILVKIDQEMRPWECSQTDRYTDWQTDANRFYNLSHAIYNFITDVSMDEEELHGLILEVVRLRILIREFLKKILRHCDRNRTFSTTNWLISPGKNWSDLRENFNTDVYLDKEVPVKFWKSSGRGVRIRITDSGSGTDFPGGGI